MDNIIKVKCPSPNCGIIISIKKIPGMETKNLTCPQCGLKKKFKEFYLLDGDTEVFADKCLEIGSLKIAGTNIRYQLKHGRNVVGRKSPTSKADFKIDTNKSRTMSREHLVIDVVGDGTEGYVHYASLYKEKVNKTFIGATQLLPVDRIILSHGTLIKLPDTTLIFETGNEDTELKQ